MLRNYLIIYEKIKLVCVYAKVMLILNMTQIGQQITQHSNAALLPQ